MTVLGIILIAFLVSLLFGSTKVGVGVAVVMAILLALDYAGFLD